MATSGLYGSSPSGATVAAPGSETAGLYGNGTTFGGSYFEWFIFIQSDTQPATPTGGSWNFTTNSGTAPTGWSSSPPPAPTLPVWVSIALVNSKNASSLTWSEPGVFSYSSGLPILSGTGSPTSGDGLNNQLWIQTGTTPQTIWFKEAGTWVCLSGSTLYVDTTSNQTIAGTKTFSSVIQGSVSGTSNNVTGIVSIVNGGTGATTANGALVSLGALGDVTSTDGTIVITSPTATTRDLSVALSAATNNVVCQVRNTTGATLAKGTVVYISGATGQIPTVSKALATSDATSAQTLGMVTVDLPNNTNGNVTIIGLINDIDTSAYADGAQLYLSGTTAGAVTATKPYAPIHLVYVAVVEYSHPVHGKLFVKVQNGYELDEIHNVSAQTPTNGQTIVYNSATGLWTQNTVSLTAGVNGTLPVANGGTGVTTSTGTGSVVLSTSPTLVTPVLGTPTSVTLTNATGLPLSTGVTGTLAIANGGTGQTTANAAFNALAPSQTGNSGKYLTTDGTNTSWATNPLGTVTSVAATVPSFLSISGSPITTSGTLAFGLSGTALPTTSGGTGLTSFTANGVVYASSTSALTTGSALTFDGTNLGVGTGTPFVSAAGRGNISINGSTDSILAFGSAGVNTGYLYATTSGLELASIGNTFVRFSTNGSEQMRLTSTGLGIGTSSPSQKLQVAGKAIIGAYANTGAYGLYLRSDASSTHYNWQISTQNTVSGAFEIARSDAVGSGTFNSPSMVIDSSGNVGIGISSPAQKLHVQDSTANNGTIQLGGTTYYGTIKHDGVSTGAMLYNIANASGGGHQFQRGGTTLMNLNQNGQLGLGLTPSVGYGKEISITGDLASGKTTIGALNWDTNRSVLYLANNATNSGAFSSTYVVNSYASRYTQDLGTHYWYNAPSGTAGNTISFTQAMTLNTSGQLLLGITTASNALLNLGNPSSGSVPFLSVIAPSNNTEIAYLQFNQSDDMFSIWNKQGYSASGIRFGTNNTERARIDVSGNLLVGTTTASGKLTVSTGVEGESVVFNNTNANVSSANKFGYVIKESGTDVVYLRYRRDSSGTAELFNVSANIAFGTGNTERARIDNSGNLLLGTTSNTGGYKLEVYGDAHFGVGSENRGIYIGPYGYTASLRYNGDGSLDIAPRSGYSIKFLSETGGTERARIDSSGNLLVGTTTNAGKLTVSGKIRTLSGDIELDSGQLTTNSDANPLKLGVNGVEKARIDSSGNFCVGTTSASAKTSIYKASGDVLSLASGNGSTGVVYYAGSTSGTFAYFVNASLSGVGSITQTNTSTAYNTSSDYRLKNTIAPMTGALAKVAQLKPVTYKWNSDGSDGEGFIAHELAEVCPHAVTGEKDAVDENGNPKYQGIDTSFLVATLTAAIQELKAEFDAYKASHP